VIGRRARRAVRRRRLTRTAALAVVLASAAGAAALATCSAGAPSERPVPGRPAPGRPAPDEPEWTASLATLPGAVASDRRGAVVLERDHVSAFTWAGAIAWRARVSGVGTDPPALSAARVVVPAARPARCSGLDRASGAPRWTARLPSAGDAPVAAAVAGRIAYCLGAAGDLVAADAGDGTRRFLIDLGRELGRGPVQASPRTAIAVDSATDTLAVVVRAGAVWLLVLRDATDGHDRGGLELGSGEPPSAPAVSGPGQLVVGDGGQRAILLVDLVRRQVVAAAPTDFSFDPASVPAVAGDEVAVVDRWGTVTAIDRASGAARWRARLPEAVLDAAPVLTPRGVAVVDVARRVVVVERAEGGEAPTRVLRSGLAVGMAAGRSPAGEPVLVVAVRDQDHPRLEAWAAA
jgi:hypothetical protein